MNRPLDLPDFRKPPLNQAPALWRDKAVARLTELCRLPHGWDGYRAGPVDVRTAEFALRLLDKICGVDAPTPSIVPGSSGDLQIEWHLRAGDIELYVRAPNEVHAWRQTPATGSDGEELELTIDFTAIIPWIQDLEEPSRAPEAATA